ncbi:MAG TPA: aminotransferase class IV [Caulobacteraceae bacterium]|jgi:branched-chain amino acid aminotransferase/4-amino-4-deoxychorismate lyase
MGPAQIPIDDRGFLLGDGLFETVLFKTGRPVLWEAHVARLLRGCAAIGLPAPDAGRLRTEADQAVAGQGLGGARAAVRLTWTAGSGGRGLGRPEPLLPRLTASAAENARPQTPATVAVSAIRRNEHSPSARLKSLGYLDNVLARREAEAAGADEALLLDTAGHLACAAAANLFWIADGRLHTPSLACGVLDGIMRAQVIAAAPVEEVRADLAALQRAEAAFLTNSLIGIRPIAALDGRGLAPHPVIDQLIARLAELF